LDKTDNAYARARISDARFDSAKLKAVLQPRQPPTDAKRPVGVISLIGGYRGTPSPQCCVNSNRESGVSKA
jgi:hypothetical protein